MPTPNIHGPHERPQDPLLSERPRGYWFWRLAIVACLVFWSFYAASFSHAATDYAQDFGSGSLFNSPSSFVETGGLVLTLSGTNRVTITIDNGSCTGGTQTAFANLVTDGVDHYSNTVNLPSTATPTAFTFSEFIFGAFDRLDFGWTCTTGSPQVIGATPGTGGYIKQSGGGTNAPQLALTSGSGWTLPTGGGGGGSWGSGDGGATEWSDMLDALPSHDTAYGACSIVGDPELGFSGASWTFATGDGFECFLSWIRYLTIPDADVAIDFVTAPLTVLANRWPFAYFTSAVAAFEDGLTVTTACPIPVLGGDTLLGTTLPELDLCALSEDVTDTITANSTVVDTLIVVLWVGFVGQSVVAARLFFTP